MINFRLGTAYSLLQSQVIGTLPSSLQGVIAGQVVRLDPTTGNVLQGFSATNPTPLTDLVGFAIQNDTDTDVTESGKLSFITLDGQSIIDTDQTAVAITATNYPVGARLTGTTGGLVVASTNASDKIIGQVVGIDSIPAPLVNVTSSAGVVTPVQGFTSVLRIKLAAL